MRPRSRPHAGARFTVTGEPAYLTLPPPVSVYPEPAAPRVLLPRCTIYRNTGSIRDDGVRVYEVSR